MNTLVVAHLRKLTALFMSTKGLISARGNFAVSLPPKERELA